MAMSITLRKGEKIWINGVLVTIAGWNTKLEFPDKTSVMRDKFSIPLSDRAKTPLHEIAYDVQLFFSGRGGLTMDDVVVKMRRAVERLKAGSAVEEKVEQNKWFEAYIKLHQQLYGVK